MTFSDDQSSARPPGSPRPFVVAYPCATCSGRGEDGPQPCGACGATGVARFLHGTKADLDCGALIEPGHGANFGDLERTTTYVYLTGTLDAATWGAELALGDGRGRIYFVEPTGPIEDDPNLTNTRFPGNPTRSYRSREPLRVVGEVVDWMGHPAEQVTAMKEELKRLSRAGVEPID
jgi:hypothetical protein